ncbi:hypothetical protein BKA62DRAFT_278516 [Auriculariales sp. MPI-PUGE-AT-0066]|nr:hypothetical protein BKA62DRAFT_278516 [Auriculariales sp. MPI-PUGE-AT-0066]
MPSQYRMDPLCLFLLRGSSLVVQGGVLSIAAITIRKCPTLTGSHREVHVNLRVTMIKWLDNRVDEWDWDLAGAAWYLAFASGCRVHSLLLPTPPTFYPVQNSSDMASTPSARSAAQYDDLDNAFWESVLNPTAGSRCLPARARTKSVAAETSIMERVIEQDESPHQTLGIDAQPNKAPSTRSPSPSIPFAQTPVASNILQLFVPANNHSAAIDTHYQNNDTIPISPVDVEIIEDQQLVPTEKPASALNHIPFAEPVVCCTSPNYFSANDARFSPSDGTSDSDSSPISLAQHCSLPYPSEPLFAAVTTPHSVFRTTLFLPELLASRSTSAPVAAPIAPAALLAIVPLLTAQSQTNNLFEACDGSHVALCNSQKLAESSRTEATSDAATFQRAHVSEGCMSQPPSISLKSPSTATKHRRARRRNTAPFSMEYRHCKSKQTVPVEPNAFNWDRRGAHMTTESFPHEKWRKKEEARSLASSVPVAA